MKERRERKEIRYAKAGSLRSVMVQAALGTDYSPIVAEILHLLACVSGLPEDSGRKYREQLGNAMAKLWAGPNKDIKALAQINAGKTVRDAEWLSIFKFCYEEEIKIELYRSRIKSEEGSLPLLRALMAGEKNPEVKKAFKSQEMAMMQNVKIEPQKGERKDPLSKDELRLKFRTNDRLLDNVVDVLRKNGVNILATVGRPTKFKRRTKG